MAYMYAGSILRIDLSNAKITKEATTSYSDVYLGGRGINIKLLYDEVPPEVGPLDPANLIIFGVGPMCGTPVPAARVEVTGKSPETGYLGSTNFGGSFGPELKFAGYDHIVITGKADKPVYIWIDNEKVEIRDADHLWGKDTYVTQEIIRSEVAPDVKIVCIGQAGENLVHYATVQHELGHGGGRTGMGAVMGAKKLKAIAVRGTKKIELADPKKYMSMAYEIEQELMKNPAIQDKQKYGTSLKNDRWLKIAERDKVPRPAYKSDLLSKYKPSRTGCFCCPVQCMEQYPVEAKGGGMISCTLYNVPGYLVKNTDIDLILETSLQAQRYGIDIISSMQVVRWLMELYEKRLITTQETDGIPMEWGSRDAILGMLKKIVHREGIGDILADGILPAAEKIGQESKDYVFQMKGLPMYTETTPDLIIPAKGEALSMVMSSRGDTMRARSAELEEESAARLAQMYDFTYGVGKGEEYLRSIRKKVKDIAGTEKAFLKDAYEGKPELTIYCEDIITICDCLSVCKNSSSMFDYAFDEQRQAALLSAGTGIDTSADMLFQFAKTVKNIERAYCVRENMTRDTDSLPQRIMDQPVTYSSMVYHDVNNVGFVKKSSVLESSKFEEMKSKYYRLRGWDIPTGIPTWDTLVQAGLEDVARDLQQRGKLPEI